MNRTELIQLVKSIMNPIGKTEREIDELIDLLKSNVPHPEVSDLIYYEDNSAEEVVDKAMAYKIISLPPLSILSEEE